MKKNTIQMVMNGYKRLYPQQLGRFYFVGLNIFWQQVNPIYNSWMKPTFISIMASIVEIKVGASQ